MKIDTVALGHATDVSMPKVGIGTWHMGEDPRTAAAEIAALRHARDLGFNHFDTAEMYADGGAETILGRAFAGQARDGVLLTSKVYPWNAAAPDMIAACERSLDRLETDHIDLYLVHWRGSVPFEDTLGLTRRRTRACRAACGPSGHLGLRQTSDGASPYSDLTRKRLAARRRNAESSPRCRPPRIDRDRYDEIYQLRSRAERGGRCGADRGAGVGPCRDRVASSIHGPETRRVVTNEVDARIYVPMHDLHVLPARI